MHTTVPPTGYALCCVSVGWRFLAQLWWVAYYVSAIGPYLWLCDWLLFEVSWFVLATGCTVAGFTVHEARCGVGGMALAARRGLIRLSPRGAILSPRCTLGAGSKKGYLIIVLKLR